MLQANKIFTLEMHSHPDMFYYNSYLLLPLLDNQLRNYSYLILRLNGIYEQSINCTLESINFM